MNRADAASTAGYEPRGVTSLGWSGLPELPPGWSWATLGSIAEVKLGKMLSPKAYEQGLVQLPYLRNENVRWGTINVDDVKTMGFKETELERYSLEAGDLMVCEGGEAGRCAVYKGHSQHLTYQKALHRIRPFGRLIDSSFIQLCLQHYVWSGTVIPRASETTIRHLPLEKMLILPIPVPPQQEQRRIVAEIEKQFTRLDAAVAALKRVRANLKRYRASVLKAACEGRLVPTEAELARAEGRDYELADHLLARILEERRARWETDQLARMQAAGKTPRDDRWKGMYEEPGVPKSAGLPELPEGWVWASIGQAFQVFVGATPSRARPEYWGGEIPWVSSGEVAFCSIRATRESITKSGLRNSSTELHPPGTVLLGMIGEGKTRGQVALLEVAACNSQNSAAIRVSEAGLPPKFVYRFLEGQYESTRQLGSGNNQPALNKSRVREMLLPLPPLSEQHRIVAEVERRLSQVDELEASVQANLKRAERMRQAILKRAFEGKLVPQDSSDEPANVLLERIRAERDRASESRRMRASGATRRGNGVEIPPTSLPLFGEDSP